MTSDHFYYSVKFIRHDWIDIISVAGLDALAATLIVFLPRCKRCDGVRVDHVFPWTDGRLSCVSVLGGTMPFTIATRSNPSSSPKV